MSFSIFKEQIYDITMLVCLSLKERLHKLRD
jgi:hypothetical protein